MFRHSLFKSAELKKTTRVRLRCYLDFDGTLTSRSLDDTYSSELYQSLLKLPKDEEEREELELADAKFIEEKYLLTKLSDNLLKSSNASMALAPGAADFLIKLLDNNAEIIIISANRKEYIRALLQVCGLEPEQINRIIIKDLKVLEQISTPNYFTVIRASEKLRSKVAAVLTCSSSLKKLKSMQSALIEARYKGKIIAHQAQPGEFNWAELSQEALCKAGLDERPHSLAYLAPATRARIFS